MRWPGKFRGVSLERGSSSPAHRGGSGALFADASDGPPSRRAQGGDVINISSIAAVDGFRGAAAYYAVKAGLQGHVEGAGGGASPEGYPPFCVPERPRPGCGRRFQTISTSKISPPRWWRNRSNFSWSRPAGRGARPWFSARREERYKPLISGDSGFEESWICRHNIR